MTLLQSRTAVAVAAPRHRTWTVFAWELEKLAAQFRVRLAFAVCLLAPVAFAAGLSGTSTAPADTLFGRWVHDSGYALPLVVLGFAGSWGFPLLTCLVAGDIFSAEDHHGTWPLLLTRAVDRRSVFTGKVLAAGAYTTACLLLLCLSSVAAGVLVIGHQPLVGLSGNVVPAGRALGLVLASWLLALPSILAFAALGVLVSVLSRHSLAGIVLPVVAGLVLQLLLLVNGVGAVVDLLPSPGFVAWHGIWTSPALTRGIGWAIPAALGYAAMFLLLAWASFRRRDVTGG